LYFFHFLRYFSLRIRRCDISFIRFRRSIFFASACFYFAFNNIFAIDTISLLNIHISLLSFHYFRPFLH